ncbi:MAG: hypothetical protein JW954_06490 [Dehalococcoidaceae bacterium]|nr:hypothetical protein [Dehalococcoidaceae bacterium]
MAISNNLTTSLTNAEPDKKEGLAHGQALHEIDNNLLYQVIVSLVVPARS